MTADLTDDEREAAVAAMLAAYNAEFNHTNNAFRRPMRAALDALLAAGWTPPEHIADAISAAEARGRREGVEAAAKECDRIAGNALDFQREYRRAAGHCAFVVRALSSIPPQEAPK